MKKGLRQKPRVRRFRRRVSGKGVTKAVKKYVKRTIHSQIENKVANIDSGDNFGTILNNPTLGAYPMLPLSGYWTISQGVTSSTRVGNQARVRKVTLNYTLRPTIYDLTTNPYMCPCEVEMFLGYIKRSPSLLPAASDINQLYQAGSTVRAPTGGLPDLIADINSDYWSIKKRWRHKIGLSTNNGGTGSTSVNSVQFSFFANNDFKLNAVRKMDITRFLPTRNIRFNDADGTSQKNLFFFYQAIYADGTIAPAAREMVHIDFWIKFEYEDA